MWSVAAGSAEIIPSFVQAAEPGVFTDPMLGQLIASEADYLCTP